MVDRLQTPANQHHPVESVSGKQPAKKRKSFLREVVETAILAVLIFVGVRAVVLNFQVEGDSMLPTLETGEMLLVNHNAYGEFNLGDLVDWIPGVRDQHWLTVTDWGEPERGDVIVFTPPAPGKDKPYVKRVIGLPGDHVQITENREVLVNGVVLNENYIGEYTTPCSRYCDLIVPDGHVFVMGDHRTDSEDSRYFGVVSNENIIGKTWLVYFPFDNAGLVDHPTYPELAP